MGPPADAIIRGEVQLVAGNRQEPAIIVHCLLRLRV
jgi:hypothetical protein